MRKKRIASKRRLEMAAVFCDGKNTGLVGSPAARRARRSRARVGRVGRVGQVGRLGLAMGRKYYHRGNPTNYKTTVKYSISHHRHTHTTVKSDAPGRIRRRPAGYAVTSRTRGLGGCGSPQTDSHEPECLSV